MLTAIRAIARRAIEIWQSSVNCVHRFWQELSRTSPRVIRRVAPSRTLAHFMAEECREARPRLLPYAGCGRDAAHTRRTP